jgi:hypothetical protein
MPNDEVNCWSALVSSRANNLKSEKFREQTPQLFVESELGFVNPNPARKEHRETESKYTDRYIARWKQGQKRALNEVYHAQANMWTGWLQKRNHVAGWQPRWFQLRWPHPALDGKWADSTQCAVLVYHSDSKGEVPFYIENVRRERWLDTSGGVAISIGIFQPPTENKEKNAAETGTPETKAPFFRRWASSSGRRRVRLMATSNLDAVAFLISLRRILHPGSALPTPHEAVHYPGRSLRKLC